MHLRNVSPCSENLKSQHKVMGSVGHSTGGYEDKEKAVVRLQPAGKKRQWWLPGGVLCEQNQEE